MKSKICFLISLALSLMLPMASGGQNDSLTLQEKKNAWLEMKAAEAKAETAEPPSPELPDQLRSDFTRDSLSEKRYYESLTRYFEYRIFGYNHRQKVFAWQLVSSKVIFFAVLFLVLAGIYFSYMQFHKALLAGEAGNADLKTDLEASPQGIKVSSPVLGVIILAISLIFFYLYLLYVYPVAETF